MKDFFVARQPIYDSEERVFAYELLFRESMDNVFPEICPNEATSRLIDGGFISSSLSLTEILKEKRCFINFTFDGLMKGQPTLLDKEQVVVEILETMRPGKKLLAAVKHLKKEGYTIALDDYIDHPDWTHFLPYIDIIKIDLYDTPMEKVASLAKRFRRHTHLRLLAERVETTAQYKACKSLGFTYFQGFYFAKPTVIKGKTLSANQTAVLELMQSLSREVVDFDHVKLTIERNVDMTFRLLHYANSSRFMTPRDITSIKQALMMLGQRELYKFSALLLVLEMPSNKPFELAKMSLIRGRFCELMAQRAAPDMVDQAFLVGILSLLDVMLDTPMANIVAKLPLSEVISDALLNNKGVLADILYSATAHERGDLDEIEQNESRLSQCPSILSNTYWEAVAWSEEQAA